MNESLSFAGWHPSSEIIPWKENFDDTYNDDGQLALLSKEIYKAEVDEDMPAFEYRYIIKAMDLQAFGSDQKTVCVRLYMCPLQQYWKLNALKGILEDDNEDWFFEDAADSGVLPCMGEKYLNYTDDDVQPDENGNKWYDYFCHITDWTKANDLFDIIATVLDPIDNMRGFSLDSVWNQIGTTGWDLLESILNDKDWMWQSIELMKLNAC